MALWEPLCVYWVTQPCLTLCDPMDCSRQASPSKGILQARILEWVALPTSKGSSQLRGRTQASCITGGFFPVWAPREDPENLCFILFCFLPSPSSCRAPCLFCFQLLCTVFSLPKVLFLLTFFVYISDCMFKIISSENPLSFKIQLKWFLCCLHWLKADFLFLLFKKPAIFKMYEKV